MLIEQMRTISYICPECGLTHFENISLFSFSGKREIDIACKCENSHLKIETKDYKKYYITVPCIGCGDSHKYVLDFYNVWLKPLNLLKCQINNTEILFLGQDREVAAQLDILEEKKNKVAELIGFEKVFENSTVMLETINKIHEIAQDEKITCECGSSDIYIDTRVDEIMLQCSICGAIEKISAKNHFDLKNISQKQDITLKKNKQYI